MASPLHPYSDYGVALRTLKSARGWLMLLLLLCVITQLVGFGLMYGTGQPYKFRKAQRVDTRYEVLKREFQRWLYEGAHGSATQQADMLTDDSWFESTPQSQRLNVHEQWDATYTMVVPVTQTLGLMAAVSQVIIVFVALLLVLVAQAPGVAQVTRSLIWATLLLFMVLPWQYFARSYPIPGILFGYDELKRFIEPSVVGDKVPGYQVFLLYARFVIWPLLAMLVLLITSERFRAGTMLAIGHPLQSMMGGRVTPGISGAVGSGGLPKPGEKKS